MVWSMIALRYQSSGLWYLQTRRKPGIALLNTKFVATAIGRLVLQTEDFRLKSEVSLGNQLSIILGLH
jgi:hypothetical protein